MSFEQSFKYLLPWEGGFGNDPRDPGGATNLGVIQTEYDRYRTEKGLGQQSVAHITRAEAAEIYETKYWQVMCCGYLNPGVANCLFDSGVNSGIVRGVRWLQLAINDVEVEAHVTVDGACGPLTIEAANRLPPDKLIDAMLRLRLAFMKVARNPSTGAVLWPTFGRGWSDRINGVQAQSHELAGLPAPEKPIVITLTWKPGTLTMGSLISTVVMGLLGSSQVQSLIRSALKVGGTALVVKAGVSADPGGMDTIIGGIMALIGVFQSVVAHAGTTTVAAPTKPA